jgi:GTP cyclohydrolase I
VEEQARDAEQDNVIELTSASAGDGRREATPWSDLPARQIDPRDWKRFRANVREILGAFGMELDTPGTRETPERFLEALLASTSGYEGDPKLLTSFPAERHGSAAAAAQIVEGPIEFQSLCEHHALPFFGHAHIGYIASERIIGISKLTRLVRLFARRFTVQERLGEQIADALVELIDPVGVAVHLEATHMCTRMRGVEEASRTITTFWRGAFEQADLRREFLHEVRSTARR